MKIGIFYIEKEDENLLMILSHQIKDEIKKINQICERYGLEKDDVRYYDTYIVETSKGSKIFKKTHEREAFNYETFLHGSRLCVPQYYGKWTDANDVWILIEDLSGNDLRDMTDNLTKDVADILAQIQNEYWHNNEQEFLKNKIDDRFEIYWRRILKRAMYLAEEPTLRKAYQYFLNRQLTCPRTLSNGDLLQFNVIKSDEGVRIIDWGFGGIMPYSLDIARFIAHATETRCTFPFYMNIEQKGLFVKELYKKLKQKPNYEQYIMDIKLAVLNEYIEFVEADEDENKWYYHHAVELAEEILETYENGNEVI